jgi:sugar phosphate isomerase/epimerase
MAKWKIGVLVDNLDMGIEPGIEQAAVLGAEGIQIYCTKGEMAPANLDAAERKRFVQHLTDLNLTLSALCGDTFKGFFDKEAVKQQIEDAKSFIDLAADLGTSVVTTHFGRFPEAKDDPSWQAAVDALKEIGEYAKKHNIYYASETGLESPEDLKRFLERVNSPNIKVNYDPANLHANGFDHIGGVDTLKKHIVHTHAKDFKRGEGEMPLGEGGVDFPAYLKALEKTGYAGFLTIEREGGDNRIGDVEDGIRFLKYLRERRR